MHGQTLIIFVRASVCALVAAALVPAADAEIVVTLRDHIELPPTRSVATEIRIQDVADVRADRKQREKIEALDLDSLSPSQQQCEITKRQITMRMLVAGFERSEFRIQGSETALIERDQTPNSCVQVERLIAAEICRQFSHDPKSVTVTLLKPEQCKNLDYNADQRFPQPLVLLPDELPIGRRRIEVTFQGNGRERTMREFDVNIVITMKLAMTAQTIRRGSQITSDMLSMVVRPISSKADFAEIGATIGKTAARDLAAHRLVVTADFAIANRSSPLASDKPQISIRTNDLIDVVATIGSTDVRLKNAKALSSGKDGDVITVLNTRSNKRFTATVVGQRLARVAAPTRRQ